MLIGCIADDFTGATDLANMLVKGGMRTVQMIGVPSDKLQADVDAVVVALKSRTIAPQEAVAQSLAALHWLQANGAQQIYFKYCSTFDSTPKGNIGPVTGALMDALKTSFTIACPAFPENGRTIFRGYLYVGDVLLSESGMKDHPLTPMTDANLVRPVKTCRWSRPDPALALALRSMRVPRGGLRTRQTPRHTHGSQALHAQLHHVIEYRPRRGPPRAAIGTNVLQRASQLAQAMRLADQIGMQRNAHHQWLAAACACIARRT